MPPPLTQIECLLYVKRVVVLAIAVLRCLFVMQSTARVLPLVRVSALTSTALLLEAHRVVGVLQAARRRRRPRGCPIQCCYGRPDHQLQGGRLTS